MTAAVGEIRHLLSRTGFGAPRPAELDALTGLDYSDAVTSVLDSWQPRSTQMDPYWLDSLYLDGNRLYPRNITRDEQKVIKRARNSQGRMTKAWWYAEMLATASPFTERMTLFWHTHFTSSLKAVKLPEMMYRQNQLLRTHSLGNFADFLHAISKDPAMMAYLDTNSNKRRAPNENFARELMELFTLGEGQGYTEIDVIEAARALTGWRVDRERGFLYLRAEHDSGAKTFLGETGRFHGEDIIDILLRQERVAVYITERLWGEFVSDAPDPAETERLAAIFRDSGYEIRPLMQALLETDAFRDPANPGSMVKSPTDLIVGTLRAVGYQPEMPEDLINVGRLMGQHLMDPPNVKGWPGGLAWIDTALLPERYAFLTAASGAIDQVMQMGDSPAPISNRDLRTASGGVDPRQFNSDVFTAATGMPGQRLASMMLPLPPSGGASAAGVLGAFLLDPVFQLK
jgi:uncharacterized protein (DUF1800 family)